MLKHLNILRFQFLIKLYLTKQLINDFFNDYIDERDSITSHPNMPHSLDWNTQLYDIIPCYIDDTWSTQNDSSILEAIFELKSYLINHINNRWCTILGTQLHNIDIN